MSAFWTIYGSTLEELVALSNKIICVETLLALFAGEIPPLSCVSPDRIDFHIGQLPALDVAVDTALPPAQ